MVITSTNNPFVKRLRSLQMRSIREAEGVFVAEGLRFVQEIPLGWPIEAYVMAESFEKKAEKLILQPNTDIYVLKDALFQKISETQAPQGILAVCKQACQTIDDVLGSLPVSGLYILCENLQDPGNLGTIIRTAHAAGAGGVFLTDGSVDLYNAKVLRSTMGSLFHIPVIQGISMIETIKKLQANGVCVYAAHLKGQALYAYDYKKPTCFLIGNEGKGLTHEATAAATDRICIPMPGHAESLNAAMAAGILLYEAVRQRQ